MTFSRTSEPMSVKASVELEEADLDRAFTDRADPDENLFFDLMSRSFDKKTIAERLSILSNVAELAEVPLAQALNLVAGEAEPK